MPTVRKTATAKKAPVRRSSAKTQPPAVVVQPVERPSATRLTPAQKRTIPTEAVMVEAPCTCMGMLIPAGTLIDGDHPVVAVRIARPCGTGHPERVMSGVIARFAPLSIRVVENALW